ncbi:MAG: SCO family protein [Geminicoccales bacterium]
MHNAVASLSVLILGCCALWQATDGLNALTTEGARRFEVVTTKPDLPNLVLEDMERSEVVLGGPRDGITFAEFIYTTCPTICRVAGEEMAQLRNRLVNLGLIDHVRLMSVSFDPTYDDPEAMAEYGELHGADGLTWTIARPRAGDLRAMLDSFGVHVIPDGFGGYEHNAALHLVDGNGRLTRIFDIDDIDGAALAAEAYR